MFKTSAECRLDLVSYTMGAPYPYILADGTSISQRMGQRDMDFMPASAARVSFGNEDRTGNDSEKDKKLMAYLAKHDHLTPFEYQHATFLIECPLFIRSQIHRHRTFSFNEQSRRYTSDDIAFWIPDVWRKQSTSNRQASVDESMDEKDAAFSAYKSSVLEAFHTYEELLEQGGCREQARAVLPQGTLTRFYMGGVLRNWIHFIKLRKDAHAQFEVRVVAERIEKELRQLWPNAVAALLDA